MLLKRKKYYRFDFFLMITLFYFSIFIYSDVQWDTGQESKHIFTLSYCVKMFLIQFFFNLQISTRKVTNFNWNK